MMCFDTPYCKHWEVEEQGTEELLGVWVVYILVGIIVWTGAAEIRLANNANPILWISRVLGRALGAGHLSSDLTIPTRPCSFPQHHQFHGIYITSRTHTFTAPPNQRTTRVVKRLWEGVNGWNNN